jgi:hypothetical protein
MNSQVLLDSGNTYVTPSISSTKTYYVETSDGTCPSARTAVQAIINQIPSPPVVSDASRCSSGTVTLSATSPYPVYWYTAQSGGNLLSSGATFTTPVINTSTTYWAETGGTCRSSRVAVQALIVAAPNSPVLSDTSICGPGIAVIRAVSNDRVNWFDVPSGGVALDTGLYFTTPNISSTTTYYAEAGLGCNSTRVPVTVTVESVPAAPAAVDSSRCGAGSVTLFASSPYTVYWYDSPAGGILLDSGATFNTPVISTTTTYYAETGGFCRSARIPVNANILSTPITSSADGFVCGPGQVLLSVNATVPADSIVWYDSPGGNVLGTGYTFTTPNITINTTFYVEAHWNCPAIPLPMNAFVYPATSVNIGPDTMMISSGQIVVLNAGANYDSYVWSTGDTIPAIQVDTAGVYSVMTTDVNGCTATDQVVVSYVLKVESITQANVIVYPNPSHDKITILLPDQKSKSISMKLTSADGKIVRHEELKAIGHSFTKTLSVSDLAAGVYILTLENSAYYSAVKVFIQ